MINCRRQVEARIYSGGENKKSSAPGALLQMLRGRDAGCQWIKMCIGSGVMLLNSE